MPHPEDNTAVDEIRGFEYGRGFKAAEAVAAPELQRLVDALAAMTADRDESRRTLNLVADELEAVNAAFAEYKRTHTWPDADPDPDPNPSIADKIQGTWVLQQVGSTAELARLKPQLLAAAALPGVVGISIRAPWDAADIQAAATTNPIWDLAKQIADEAEVELSIRFMAGAHTPNRVFAAGAAYYLKGNAKVPLPWSNSTGDHTVFLREYQTYAGKLADWCRANGVKLLHLSWWGQDWAELNHGKELRDAEGYTEAKWLAGAKGLIDVAPNVIGDGLAVELPLSGYGPLSGGQSAAIADHIIAKVADHPDEFFVQANGLGPNGEWGAPSQAVEADFDRIWSKAIARGVQMIQPQDYDWAPVFAHAREARATYVEVYLPSFTLSHHAQLGAEIAAFEEN